VDERKRISSNGCHNHRVIATIADWQEITGFTEFWAWAESRRDTERRFLPLRALSQLIETMLGHEALVANALACRVRWQSTANEAILRCALALRLVSCIHPIRLVAAIAEAAVQTAAVAWAALALSAGFPHASISRSKSSWPAVFSFI
jgi:hypothetical protein